MRRTRTRRSSRLAAAALCALQVPAQTPAVPTYPWEIQPLDAIYGHLSEGRFQEPVGVFFEPGARELYVADSKNGLIGIFNPERTPLFAFGGPALLVEPRALQVLPDGTIFVLDALQTELRCFNYRGELRAPLAFARPGSEAAASEPVHLKSFVRAPDGRWFVADQQKDGDHLLLFDRERRFVREFEASKKAGQYHSISDLALSVSGKLAVIDQQGAPAIHVYDARGGLIAAFGVRDVGLKDFTAPIAIAFDEQEYLFAVDLLKHDVKIFDVKGEYLERFGGWNAPETRGRAPGEMLYPTDIAIAPDGGEIYVSERFGGRVQVFTRKLKPKPEAKLPAGGTREAPRR